MQALAQRGYTADEVRAALQGRTGARRWSFRYEHLDESNNVIGDLDGIVESCSITQEWLADIKRRARFVIRDTGEIDYLSDRIRPWVRLHLPPYGPDDYVEWPQGVFLLSTPTRSIDASGKVVRQVEAWDQILAYSDDKVADRYAVTSGTAYTDAVLTLLGSSVQLAVTPSASTLPVDREWDPGTSKLTIINNLLSSVNYQSLSFDETGRAVVTPYVAPSARVSEYTYSDDDRGLIVPNVDQTFDLFSVPNRWVLVVSNPDQGAITGEYLNQDPTSPTSTVRRGRTITDFRTEQDAADSGTLDQIAARLAFEASQVYEHLRITTGLMPIHSGNDVYTIQYSDLAINAKYSEQSWSMDLRAGAPMSHTVRRVVNV